MTKKPKNQTNLIGLTAYLLLGSLSVVFYLERTAYSDLAFHTVTILKTKSLFIQNQRFVSVFTQLFPLTAQGLNFSLKGVMMAYSASFVLLPGLVFTACIRWLKDWKMAIVMLLLSTMMVKDTFYWIQSELPQGLAVLVLVLTMIRRFGEQAAWSKGWPLGLVFVLGYVVAYAHPMLAFPTFFALLFFWEKQTHSTENLRNILTASAVFFVAILLIKNKLLGAAAYDAEQMNRVKNLKDLFPHYFDLASNRIFLQWCLTDYWMLTIGFIAANYVYLRQQNRRKLVLFNAFFFGYLLLVNVSIPDGFFQYYMENLYLPLSFFVALPVVFDVLPFFGKKSEYPKWAFSALAVCIGMRLLSIGWAHGPWTDMVNWKKQFMVENSGKLIVSEKLVPMDKLLMSWGSSYEFMLLSSLENPDSTRLIDIDEEPARLAWATKQPRSVITEWDVWPFETLPQQYFNPQETDFYVICDNIKPSD